MPTTAHTSTLAASNDDTLKMEKLKWVDSAGGPLILIGDKSVGLWSGILKRSAYLTNVDEGADNFLDPGEADYGKACLIEDYLGLVKVDGDEVLVLGDEPMLTTFFFSQEKPVLARWCYGEDKEFIDNILLNINLSSIIQWEFALTFNLTSDKQFLFDSACSKSMIDKRQEDCLDINMKRGQYKLSTSVYEPDRKTKLILHKFEVTDRPVANKMYNSWR